MIGSFAAADTRSIFLGKRVRRLPPDIHDPARRRLRQLGAAERLDDMRQPPRNRLEQLKGFTPPRYSLRIDDQWR
ncbi:type II toxin-antitoxin system RelE/ParE family toxin [Sphingomonas sp. A2-49]|uniref:type II toxin-antitoxin system RelE/ParE family toxin n=1 Tax=Sphingomonas sp. A2-49 TaxID=1391375 RepID=UPI0021CEC6CE|nr:type II toxin-antitoxin system RelE/ParE family toxin [Sphingomonas sp. A2-49]MCU6455986.1 type II toxin-antitoxin system RelE/ParE family toxin [Sphingomonas sp. A2-49]